MPVVGSKDGIPLLLTFDKRRSPISPRSQWREYGWRRSLIRIENNVEEKNHQDFINVIPQWPYFLIFIIVGTKSSQLCLHWLNAYSFYPRPVLAFGSDIFVACVSLSMCPCVHPSVRQPWVCPHDDTCDLLFWGRLTLTFKFKFKFNPILSLSAPWLVTNSS